MKTKKPPQANPYKRITTTKDCPPLIMELIANNNYLIDKIYQQDQLLKNIILYTIPDNIEIKLTPYAIKFINKQTKETINCTTLKNTNREDAKIAEAISKLKHANYWHTMYKHPLKFFRWICRLHLKRKGVI